MYCIFQLYKQTVMKFYGPESRYAQLCLPNECIKPQICVTLFQAIQVKEADSIYFEKRYWKPVNTPVLDLYSGVSHIIHCVQDVTDPVRARNHSVSVAAKNDEQAQQIVDQRHIAYLFQQPPLFMAMLIG